ncbi:MAG: hypothetical protein ACYC0X_23630 [Pirellulaceae bacterium]
MPLRRRKELKPDSNGRYYRNLGWERDPETGECSQPKFWLGKDPVQADRRCHRLEELWERVEELWASVNRGANDRPAWDTFTLRVGKQLARGEWQVVVTCSGESPAAYAQKINTLATRYPCLQFVPEDNTRYIAGQLYNEQVIDASVAEALGAANEMGYTAGVPIHDGQGSIHQAFDAYIRWLKDHKHKAWINTQVQQVERLKQKHADIPLSSVDFDVCEAMVRLWRNRPMAKGRNKPISAKTAENHIKQLKAFFRWLHRSQLFSWRKPEDLDEIDTRVPKTAVELQAVADTEQVETFTREELCILNEYATPLERVLLLLGLNCGFGAAESGTLLLNQMFLFQFHPKADIIGFETSPKDSFIRRVRVKNGVYGEHMLWAQTVEGLQWAVARRQRIGNATSDAVLLVSEQGEPLFHETETGNAGRRIQNLWYGGLMRRVVKDHPEFRTLSFGKLRKTAGNLIRRYSDGETQGVFLCHGQPVKSDELSDIYANRDFAKVFAAIRAVGEFLQPVFDASPKEPFASLMRQSKGRTVGKRIQQLRSQGVSVAKIGKQVGLSRSAVYRRLETGR